MIVKRTRRPMRSRPSADETIARACWRQRFSREWRQHLFRGAPPLNEVVFFHPATRTLILTDLFQSSD
jgi:hypothetical protein